MGEKSNKNIDHQQENTVAGTFINTSNQDPWAHLVLLKFWSTGDILQVTLLPITASAPLHVAFFSAHLRYRTCVSNKGLFYCNLVLQRQRNGSCSQLDLSLHGFSGAEKKRQKVRAQTDGWVEGAGADFRASLRSDWEAGTFDSSSWLHQSSNPACTLEAHQKTGLRNEKGKAK